MINDHTQWLYHAEHGGRLFQKGELTTKGWYDSPDFANANAMWGETESDDAPDFEDCMLAEDGQAEPDIEPEDEPEEVELVVKELVTEDAEPEPEPEDAELVVKELVTEEDDEEFFTCPICGKVYRSEAWLDKHIHKEHSGDE